MGASASNQRITSTQKVTNTMIQSSRQLCDATCNNNLSNTTIIVSGGEGDIDITQQCAIDNITCIMGASFDAQLENTLESMLTQSATAMSAGFNMNFAATNQNTNLNQYITNSTTQLMDSSCNFTASNNIDNLYFFVEDRDGNINISQSATISNSSCNMDNVAKNTVYNAASASADQESKISQLGAMGMIMVVIIIMVILGAIMMVITKITGGGSSATSAGGQNRSSSGSQGRQPSGRQGSSLSRS